jgi:GNAT superfamily N-acetyltransferase
MLPISPLPELRIVELGADTEPLLQRFFEANPFYFESVHGEPAQIGEAHQEIFDELPAGWSFTKKWVLGYFDTEGNMMAMANVVSDLLAGNVWHIGTFIVATEWHGTGKALALYQGLEAWALSCGARWLRLGVVAGHHRAERFWSSRGYAEVALREGISMGKRVNVVRVMVKSMYGEGLSKYFDLMARDRPAPPNLA